MQGGLLAVAVSPAERKQPTGGGGGTELNAGGAAGGDAFLGGLPSELSELCPGGHCRGMTRTRAANRKDTNSRIVARTGGAVKEKPDLDDHPAGPSSYQLFHLKAAPFEQNNLALKIPKDLRRRMWGLINTLEQHHALYPLDQDRQPLKPKPP
jgi:hypothetical protein